MNVNFCLHLHMNFMFHCRNIYVFNYKVLFQTLIGSFYIIWSIYHISSLKLPNAETQLSQNFRLCTYTIVYY